VRDFDPQYSPDGSHIVYASEQNSPGFSEIYVMDANGGDGTQLTDVPNSYSPTWSPDGTHIAYVSDQQGDGDIYVMDADGQRPFLLTQDDNGAEDRSPAWSPDGRWILFASNRGDDSFRWYAIDLQGDLQPVTVTGRNPESLSFLTR
jgi:Tol biopolymer transport system component